MFVKVGDGANSVRVALAVEPNTDSSMVLKSTKNNDVVNLFAQHYICI